VLTSDISPESSTGRQDNGEGRSSDEGAAGGTAIIPAIADTSLKPQRRNNWAARISCGRPFGGSSGDIAIVFGLSKMAAMDFIE